MALTPPEDRLWWKQPLHGIEIGWITISLLWGFLMFGVMIYWHLTGEQNLSNEAYRINPDAYAEKVEAAAALYTVREDEQSGMPVVHPPPGSDVYMLARLWEWWPILELEEGKEYRLHLSSLDWMHGFSLQPTNINLQIHPNYEMVVTITPDKAGEYGVVCNEFCGIGHHQMLGKLIVVK
ncbi:MAG: cytochrome C oxidase subunit II [Rhodospirillales bacterium]|nr:cytochrome C oxidase subunit II [Rhodospirillales bacterium]MBT4039525.1 cytochrome C oxidase subunit II [Rhodospirillales bacterium]MBT4626767.1 cytochrome C oxidase subunit II [Rhodospirillales bacterium]MBT5352879.1 cytochrome C oxidase subunit II [Rhodospirillales bacterium]MBT5519406.1 cytochrome C oxidase subunit II [Rhodospirillales bacterium]